MLEPSAPKKEDKSGHSAAVNSTETEKEEEKEDRAREWCGVCDWLDRICKAQSLALKRYYSGQRFVTRNDFVVLFYALSQRKSHPTYGLPARHAPT